MLNRMLNIVKPKSEMASGNPVSNGREGFIHLALFQRPFVLSEERDVR